MLFNRHRMFTGASITIAVLFLTNLAGCGGARSSGNSSTTLTANDIVENVQAIQDSSGNAVITWDVIPDTFYNVYVSNDNGQSFGLVSANQKGPEFIDKNIPLNITLLYNITATSVTQTESDQSLFTSSIINESNSKIISASQHSCLIKSDGALWCWGKNDFGQLGIGTKTRSELPTQELTLAFDWQQVSVGYNHTCAIKNNGDMYCWGDIAKSSVSINGGVADLWKPMIITGSQNWTKISLGKNKTCGIKNDSKLYCFSGNSADTISRLDNQQSVVIDPITKNEIIGWSDISLGLSHACGILVTNNESKILCWGDRLRGQLADNNAADTTTASFQGFNIESSNASNWYKISVGNDYSCGIQRDNSLWCWGANNAGQLGIDDLTNTDQHTPQQVNISGQYYTDWIDVELAANHTCGIRKMAGINNSIEKRIFCWGKNSTAQLGDRSLVDSLAPVQAGDLRDNDWLALAIGKEHSCAIKQNNTLYCWGSRLYKGVGLSNSNSNIPIQIGTETSWNRLSLSSNYTVGNIGVPGGGFSWGDNSAGQFDDGSVKNKQSPGTKDNFSLDRRVTGNNHLCGYPSVNVGAAEIQHWKCWGDNSSGQLAIPPSVYNSPNSNGWDTFYVVTAGAKHTCGIKLNRLWCWGNNTFGQLGIGSVGTAPVAATEVKHPDGLATPWKDVSAGNDFTCAIDNSVESKIYCWGNNSSNQLAIKTATILMQPTLAEAVTNTKYTVTNTNWVKIKSNANTSCAIKNDGMLYCWGSNSYGKIKQCNYITRPAGNNNAIKALGVDDFICKITSGFIPYYSYYDATLSIEVIQDKWKDFAIGLNHICAIKLDNTIWCSGDNSSGQRGLGRYDFQPEFNQEQTLATSWSKIETGKNHSCAIANVSTGQIPQVHGSLWCWGDNSVGQLGSGNAWQESLTSITVN